MPSSASRASHSTASRAGDGRMPAVSIGRMVWRSSRGAASTPAIPIAISAAITAYEKFQP